MISWWNCCAELIKALAVHVTCSYDLRFCTIWESFRGFICIHLVDMHYNPDVRYKIIKKNLKEKSKQNPGISHISTRPHPCMILIELRRRLTGLGSPT